MLKYTSNEFRTFFLLEFTKELLRNSKIGEEEIHGLKEVIKEEENLREIEIKQEKEFREKQKEKKKEAIRKAIQKRENVEMSDLQEPLYKPSSISITAPPKKRVLRIPVPKIPKHLQHLKPTPAGKLKIDLGKLNSFMKDPTIKDIECNGPDTNIIVKGVTETKKTNIILTKQEIDEVIKKFSDASKTPLKQGMFKVTVDKVVFSAIISEIAGSRFIIKKMLYNPTI